MENKSNHSVRNSEDEVVKQVGESFISRRKLLASLGAAGAALAAGGLLNGGSIIAYGKTTVTESVYGKSDDQFHWKDLIDLDLCVAVTLAELRTMSDSRPEDAYYVTDSGKEGFFLFDPSDLSSPDNTGTVIVTSGGKRFKRVFNETVLASWFEPKADGVTIDTVSLQNALNAASGQKLFIPKQKSGHYLTGQLFVPSDIVIEFEPGTVIQAVDTLSRKAPYERLIRIKNVKNVHIIGNGATLQMNKAAYTSGEQAHIFDIGGSENVIIERVNANDSGGDGFYIGNYESSQVYSKDIVLRQCVANNNRRQGMSVISVDGLLVEGCRFTNTTGTAPKSGVDIEPNNNSGKDVLKRIRFVDCIAEGNVGRGFLVSLHRMTSANERVDITFQGCRTKRNSFGSSVNYGAEGTKAVKGEVTFIDCSAEEEQYAGYSVLSSSPESVKSSFVRCRAVNCNTVNAPEDPYGYGSSFIVTTVPQFPRAAIGNVEFHECESIEERGTPLIVRGFSLKKNKTEAIRNVRFVNCFVKGGGQRLLYVDSSAEQVFAELRPQPGLPVTSSRPIDSGLTGHHINNAEAQGAITLSLPQAKEGNVFKFSVESPNSVTIAAQSGASVRTPFGAKTVIESANPGDSITLTGRFDGNWDISCFVGSWFGNAPQTS
jgi:hypothetical protein